MSLVDAPVAQSGFFVTHFLTVRDQEKSKAFYVGVLGGKVVKPENPRYIKLSNSSIILNSGGGPTPDKSEIFLEAPRDLNRVNHFLNLWVAELEACYKEWKAKGAHFLTEPLDNHGWESRCYMPDPNGYIIEVGQYTESSTQVFAKFNA
jgi:catechol 2,3-dioxygenase-like lactoylglutathione lyase family enzyme